MGQAGRAHPGFPGQGVPGEARFPVQPVLQAAGLPQQCLNAGWLGLPVATLAAPDKGCRFRRGQALAPPVGEDNLEFRDIFEPEVAYNGLLRPQPVLGLLFSVEQPQPLSS